MAETIRVAMVPTAGTDWVLFCSVCGLIGGDRDFTALADYATTHLSTHGVKVPL